MKIDKYELVRYGIMGIIASVATLVFTQTPPPKLPPTPPTTPLPAPVPMPTAPPIPPAGVPKPPPGPEANFPPTPQMPTPATQVDVALVQTMRTYEVRVEALEKRVLLLEAAMKAGVKK